MFYELQSMQCRAGSFGIALDASCSRLVAQREDRSLGEREAPVGVLALPPHSLPAGLIFKRTTILNASTYTVHTYNTYRDCLVGHRSPNKRKGGSRVSQSKTSRMDSQSKPQHHPSSRKK